MRLRTSSAAELQSLQTRARISAALWSQALSSIFLAWIVATIWLIWHRIGVDHPDLHHVYFIRWIFGGILLDTPILGSFTTGLPMYAGGVWYHLTDFTAWLDQLYGTSFYGWCARAAIGTGYYGLGTDLLPLGTGAALFAWWYQRNPEKSDHLRGLRLISIEELNREIQDDINPPTLARLISRFQHEPAEGLKLGQIVLPYKKLCEHFMVTGNTGSGKTNTIRSMLRQIQQLGKCAIVVDREGEYTKEFYQPERGDWILNPLDARCPYWSPWSEIRDDFFPVDAASMAASLIRGFPRNENERFFQNSTRTVIESILFVMRERRSINDLLAFVGQQREDLHEQLRGTPAYPLIDPKAAEQGSGILGTAANAIKTFGHLPRQGQTTRSWAAREWEEHRQGWIFFPSREDLYDSIQPLQGLWLDCLIRWLMTREECDHQVFLMLDEIASMGHQAQLEKAMTRGRKREISVTLGLQNVSQLKAIYGPEGALTLTSQPSTKLIMRVDEPETAKACSELIGKHQLERVQLTQLAGLSTYREGLNLSPHREIEALVMADEIKLLKPGEGYLCIAGHNRAKIEIPELALVKNQPAFVSRTLPIAAESTPVPTENDIVDRLTARSALPVVE